MPEFYMILAPKIIKKYPNFYYLPEKFTKFPNFTRFLPQNARILHNNCPKKYFSLCPPPFPTPMKLPEDQQH